MKIKLIAARRDSIENEIARFLGRDVTAHAIAYAIGPQGQREALVLYSDGATPELPAAVKTWLKEQVG